MFQHNHCFGSIVGKKYRHLKTKVFQHNHCFGSILERIDEVARKTLFQHNHCFGSMDFIFRVGTSQQRVSTQPLFRFNIRKNNYTIFGLFEFQHNHCFGSIIKVFGAYAPAARFQHNHCFGSIFFGQFYFSKSNIVSTQPLFRFNKIF